MSKYAVYASSRIYHLMRDEKYTQCDIPVFESHSSDHYRRGGAVLKIVDSIPAGLRLCQHCSGEGSTKKGSKKQAAHPLIGENHMATKRRRENNPLSAPTEVIGEVVKQTSRLTGEVIERASNITNTAQEVAADWAETVSPEAARMIRPGKQKGSRQRSASGTVKKGLQQASKSVSRATKAADRATSRSAKSVAKAAKRSKPATKKGSAKAGRKKRTKK